MKEIDEQHPHGGDWLRGIVFGLNDGLVTTLVFIMAVSAVASNNLVLIALGEVVAGGISMALGGYLSSRTSRELLEQRIATERHEIAHEPEEERAELRTIYERKGLRGVILDRVVDDLTADDELWLQVLVSDELGVMEGEQERPWLQGFQVGSAFVLGGLIPTIPLLLSLPFPQFWAYGLTATTALLLGAVKSRYTQTGPVRAGLEFLAIVTGGTLAGVAVGLLLHAL